ncbi:MAG: thiamine pyrophosphate-dependent enzyme, partial [Spirochaetes bacterium]|nr:thiamine pyrophosphate-dependent enzyme [Spirochaetota bacterium]
ASLVEKQKVLEEWSFQHPVNKLTGSKSDLAVITSGIGGNYYEENLADLIAMRKKKGKKAPVYLHIGAYPLPEKKIRKLCESANEVLVIEEGQNFIAKKLYGIAGGSISPIIQCGELDPDNVRAALGLPPHKRLSVKGTKFTDNLPPRPPQLCKGCPHADSYQTINKAVAALDPRDRHPDVAVSSDIGCYSLGALPPFSAIESVICMGASVGMAKGASDAGLKHSIAVIGDSTFIHSGITALIDAVVSDTPMTLVILDNSTVAMTGCQPTIVPSEKLVNLILGCGVKPERLLQLEAKNHLINENAAKLKAEIEHRGLSVVIFRRECLEALRKNKKNHTA